MYFFFLLLPPLYFLFLGLVEKEKKKANVSECSMGKSICLSERGPAGGRETDSRRRRKRKKGEGASPGVVVTHGPSLSLPYFSVGEGKKYI